MTLYSQLFPGDPLLSRKVYPYLSDSSVPIVAPAKAAFIRVSMVAGGAAYAGAAFSRTKAACTPGESFGLVVGRRAASLGLAGTDSVLTRVTGSVIICRAKAANGNSPGLASGGIGDTKRSGVAALYDYQGGASGGDDDDAFPLGFGGAGAYENGDPGNASRAPYPGAGGNFGLSGGATEAAYGNDIPPAHGRAVVEFFLVDPGY